MPGAYPGAAIPGGIPWGGIPILPGPAVNISWGSSARKTITYKSLLQRGAGFNRGTTASHSTFQSINTFMPRYLLNTYYPDLWYFQINLRIKKFLLKYYNENFQLSSAKHFLISRSNIQSTVHQSEIYHVKLNYSCLEISNKCHPRWRHYWK